MAQEESNRQNQLLHARDRGAPAHRRRAAGAPRKLAEAANQAKTRYVTGMTHELRTPLNSILGYAQILLKDDADPRPRRATRSPPSSTAASTCWA